MLKLRYILISLFLILLCGCSTTSIAIVDEPLDVSIQDYFGEIQSYFLIRIDKTTTLTTDTKEFNNTITVTNATGCIAGNDYAINIYDNESLFQGIITNVSGNVITFSPLLDKDFLSSNTFVECGRWNMNVLGTLNNPVIFEIHPPTNITWHIESNNIQCQDNLDWDSNNFCGRSALTNGLITGVIDGYHKHLWLIYNNAGFGLRGFDLTDYAKAPAGLYGYGAKLLFEQNYGAIIRLEGKTKDSFRYGVQDDFTSISMFSVEIGAHKATD